MKRQRSLTTLFTFLKEFEMNVNPRGWENRWMNDWSSWYNVNVSVMLNSSIVQSLATHFWVLAQGHVYTTLEGSIFYFMCIDYVRPQIQ